MLAELFGQVSSADAQLALQVGDAGFAVGGGEHAGGPGESRVEGTGPALAGAEVILEEGEAGDGGGGVEEAFAEGAEAGVLPFVDAGAEFLGRGI